MYIGPHMVWKTMKNRSVTVELFNIDFTFDVVSQGVV